MDKSTIPPRGLNLDHDRGNVDMSKVCRAVLAQQLLASSHESPFKLFATGPGHKDEKTGKVTRFGARDGILGAAAGLVQKHRGLTVEMIYDVLANTSYFEWHQAAIAASERVSERVAVMILETLGNDGGPVEPKILKRATMELAQGQYPVCHTRAQQKLRAAMFAKDYARAIVTLRKRGEIRGLLKDESGRPIDKPQGQAGRDSFYMITEAGVKVIDALTQTMAPVVALTPEDFQIQAPENDAGAELPMTADADDADADDADADADAEAIEDAEAIADAEADDADDADADDAGGADQ